MESGGDMTAAAMDGGMGGGGLGPPTIPNGNLGGAGGQPPEPGSGGGGGAGAIPTLGGGGGGGGGGAGPGPSKLSPPETHLQLINILNAFFLVLKYRDF